MTPAELFPIVYAELRRLAAAQLGNEGDGHSLNPTALVHEAFLRLVGNSAFENRGHFFGAAAEAMRRILVDQARTRNATKRGGGRNRENVPAELLSALTVDDELLAVDEALDALTVAHPEHAELVKLRYFGGLSLDEVAAALGISPSTADRRWTYAKAWLKKALLETGNTRNH
jgi:RNA polymerase sigma factor (TIGR02999 family)